MQVFLIFIIKIIFKLSASIAGSAKFEAVLTPSVVRVQVINHTPHFYLRFHKTKNFNYVIISNLLEKSYFFEKNHFFYFFAKKSALHHVIVVKLCKNLIKGEIMYFSKMQSIVCAFVISFAVCLLSGCVKSKTLVKVKNDGSGNIVVTNFFSPKFLKVFEENIKKHKMNIKLIDEERIKQQAGNLGKDVTFKKMKAFEKAGSKGYIAIYSFKNVKDLKLSMRDTLRVNKAVTFDFIKEKDGVSKLTINMPKIEKPTKTEPAPKDFPTHELDENDKQQVTEIRSIPGNPYNFTEKETKESMIKKMMSDLSVSLQVEIEGKLIKSNAKYPSKKKTNRFTMFDINMAKMCKSKKFLYNCAEAGSDIQFNLLKIMSTAPEGFTYDNQNKINLEFK